MSLYTEILLALSPVSYCLVEKLAPTSLEAFQHALMRLKAFQHALTYSVVISPANNGLLVYLASILLNSSECADEHIANVCTSILS